MERVSRDEMLMGVARAVSLRGTCSRASVGAVVSREGRIIATGYNGAPAGLPHCDHENEVVEERDVWNTSFEGVREAILSQYPDAEVNEVAKGCEVSEHAERNAIAFAARYGLALEGGEIHCTHAPCLDCARSIINAGITKVSYEIPYRLTAGVELLRQAKLDVVDMSII